MKTEFNDYGNPQVANLPSHLRQFIVDQNYGNYTAVDQAVWRYVMRKNISYLKDVADSSYLNGLEKTGITIDTIPNIQDMNTILGKIGWGCVCVDGFLPPSSFMEFQACKVLVIAAEIRQIEHIEYTPAPDILHEAAGHAPIIADPMYAEYLRLFGEIGSKAISSARDFELYEAIRHLSIIKEDPNTPQNDISEAEKAIDDIQSNMGEPSEMARIRNLHWWTVEYGLIGDLSKPKIYGAGLLSSIGESESCLKDHVKKVPYSIEAANRTFDITEPQPQLFVTPNYNHLTTVLEQFADSLSLRTGGHKGLQKAIQSKGICTAQYSSGLQVSGIFNHQIVEQEKVIYLSTSSPSALSYQNKQIVGHGKNYHQDGFSSPVGRLKGQSEPIESMNITQLNALGIMPNQHLNLEFESGVIVQGNLLNIFRNSVGVNMIFSFKDCTVTYKNQTLFKPEWGIYDMAVGEKITSVFSGVADKYIDSKENPFVPTEKTHKIKYSQERLRLNNLYQQVREVRDEKRPKSELPEIWQKLKKHQNDWLCALEILEINEDPAINQDILSFLKSDNHKTVAHLINDGINIKI